MKEKEIKIYLTFDSPEIEGSVWENYSGYNKYHSGGGYILVAEASKTDKKYVDFDVLADEFVAECQKKQDVIDKLCTLDGKFSIEVVPTFTAKGVTPAITFNKNMLKLFAMLGDRLEFVDIDMYVI